MIWKVELGGTEAHNQCGPLRCSILRYQVMVIGSRYNHGQLLISPLYSQWLRILFCFSNCVLLSQHQQFTGILHRNLDACSKMN